MARRKTKAKSRRTGHVAIPDETLIARLKKEAPEVLTADVSESAFDRVVNELLKEPLLADEFPHFYCRRCGEYHLKTHPHYASIKKSI